MTTIHIHEFDCKTKTFSAPVGVPVSNEPWNDCLNAIQTVGYKSQQKKTLGLAIQAPGKWVTSNPGSAAVSTKFKSDKVKTSMHVHAALGHETRAVFGHRLETNGGVYRYMNIYIGQFGSG